MTQFKGCLKGSSDPIEAARTIEFLTRLGGVNSCHYCGETTQSDRTYFIDETGRVNWLVGIPDGYTLIELQPDVLLPVSWCVADCESVRKYVSPVSNCKFYGENTNYITTDGFRTIGADKPFGILLTESQFLALTAPSAKEDEPEEDLYDAVRSLREKKEKENAGKEIEGYVCPMDLWVGSVPKGSLFKKVNAIYRHYGDPYEYNLPAEIVETWEPKYKEVRRPLFTTEDGVEVFEGDDCYYIQKGTFSAVPWYKVVDDGTLDKITTFSTKQAAENYIVENKPVLTLKDVISLSETWVPGVVAEQARKLIQSKIKG